MYVLYDEVGSLHSTSDNISAEDQEKLALRCCIHPDKI